MRLPPFPAGTIACPADFGTSYKLVFEDRGQPALTAVISAQGCRGVTLSDGRVLWALSSPSLDTDLGAALGLTQDQLIPFPCPPPQGTVCSGDRRGLSRSPRPRSVGPFQERDGRDRRGFPTSEFVVSRV